MRAVALNQRDLAALTLRGEIVRRRYGLVAALPWFDAALKRDACTCPPCSNTPRRWATSASYSDSLGAIRRQCWQHIRAIRAR
ncbi:hypothetical protein AB5I41_28225 [Sphingomonas sp. MMS24-JH45]